MATETQTTEVAQVQVAPTIVPIIAERKETEAPAQTEVPTQTEAPVDAEKPSEPVQEQPTETTIKPKIRRILDEEGGTTTATV